MRSNCVRAVWCGCHLVIAPALIGALCGLPVATAQEKSDAVERGRRAVAATRRAFDTSGIAPEDSWSVLTYRGRPALEIKGKAAAVKGVRLPHDFAIYDPLADRLALYILFAGASRRQAGEAILPMSEIATRADAHMRAVVPERTLALESIQRYRASGKESIYYEVRYAPQVGEIRYVRPPVRLLVDASTGNLYRFDVDPEVLDPLPPPPSRITRQSAERVASVTLRGRNLGAQFGAGASFGKIVGADLFYVRPNDWLGLHPADPAARARVAWVVGFTVEQCVETGRHSLFVDAGSGRVIGGMAGSP